MQFIKNLFAKKKPQPIDPEKDWREVQGENVELEIDLVNPLLDGTKTVNVQFLCHIYPDWVYCKGWNYASWKVKTRENSFLKDGKEKGYFETEQHIIFWNNISSIRKTKISTTLLVNPTLEKGYLSDRIVKESKNTP